jgi:hypothetical protein
MAKKIGTTVNDALPFAFDKDEYNRLCGGSQILLVQLIASNLNVNAKYFSHSEEAVLKLDNCILGAWLDDDKESVTAIFRYEIKARHNRRDLVSFRSDFLVTYAIPEGVDVASAEAYCERAGLFAAYPYFRSHFSHMNDLANLSLPILPVLRTGPVRVAKKGEQAPQRRVEDVSSADPS